MYGKILLSTAYFPPIEYFARLLNAEEAFIEKEENYLKQSYRNRCYILSSDGPQLLTIPVLIGSLHKTPIKDIRIDYSKRWQQVHTGAIVSSYSSAPYFIYYYEILEKIIMTDYEFLIDLNTDLLFAILKITGIESRISYSTDFQPVNSITCDFRYTLSPKKKSLYSPREYIRVFKSVSESAPRLSILDLIFNTGPEAKSYL